MCVLQDLLQRSVSVEDQRQGAPSSRPQSKTTLNELLDTLKLLEEEPEKLSEPRCYQKEKYAWIDEVSVAFFIHLFFFLFSFAETVSGSPLNLIKGWGLSDHG